jgi:hypothetical protein
MLIEGPILRCIALQLTDNDTLHTFVKRCNQEIRAIFEEEGCGHTQGPFWRWRVFPHYRCCVRCRPHIPGLYSLDEIRALHKSRLPPEQDVGPYYPQTGIYPYDGAPEGVYYYPEHVIDKNVQNDVRLYLRTKETSTKQYHQQQQGIESFLKKQKK